MEYYYIFYITVVFVTQFPSHSAISIYNNDQRTHRRHIDLTYAHYWETGLKEATYRTFLRKGYADPSLKDQIINAPLVTSNTEQATPFGDVAVLARGQLFYSAGGFLFVQDERSYDCDECDDEVTLHRESPGQIVSLWTVKRLRHRDSTGLHRYETEYLISPVKDENYWKRNGDYNYDIPAYVFVLKNAQNEHLAGNIRNYLPQTPVYDWYDSKGSFKYASTPYNKIDRHYLPPQTTTDIPLYYAIPKMHHEYHKNPHQHDPDIIPARNNIEKEAELYKQFLESLRTTQSTTMYTSESSMASDGFEIFNRVTPIIPPPSVASTRPFLSSQTQHIRFPQTTPFRPSPMYTRYSEPDPLYTTAKSTTTGRSIYHTEPMKVVDTTTEPSTTYHKSEETTAAIVMESISGNQPILLQTTKSTFYASPVNLAKTTSDKSIISPGTMQTSVTNTKTSTSYPRPLETTTLSMKKSTDVITRIEGKSTSRGSVSLNANNFYLEKSTFYPTPMKTTESTITTSSERTSSAPVKTATSNISKLTNQAIPSITNPHANKTTISIEESTFASVVKATSYSVPIEVTRVNTENTLVTPELIKTSISSDKSIPNTQSTFYSTPAMEKSTKTTSTPTEKQAVYEKPTKSPSNKSTESTIIWTTYVAESSESAPTRKKTIKEYEPTQQSPPIPSPAKMAPVHSSVSLLITEGTTRRPELDFDIFSIFDKPKKMEATGRSGHVEVDKKDSSEAIKTQMLSPEIIVRTTMSYIPTTQISVITEKASPPTTTVQDNTTSFQVGLKNFTKQDDLSNTDAVTENYEAQSTNFVRDIFKNDTTINEDISPTISYDKITEMMIIESTNAYPSTIPTSKEIATKELETTNTVNTERLSDSSTTVFQKKIKEESSTTTAITTPVNEQKLTTTTMTSEETTTEIENSPIEKEADTFNKPILSKPAMAKNASKTTTIIMTDPKLTNFSKRYKSTTSLPKFKMTPKFSTVSTTRRYKYTKLPKRKDYKVKKFDTLTTSKATSLIKPYTTTTESIQYRENDSETAKQISTANKKLDNNPKSGKKDILHKQTLEATILKAKSFAEIEKAKVIVEAVPYKVENISIAKNKTEEILLHTTSSNDISVVTTSETKVADSSTNDEILLSSNITTIKPTIAEVVSNVTREQFVETTTQAQVVVKLDEETITKDVNLTTTAMTTPSSKEIFEDLFGAYAKVMKSTTVASTTKKTNELNRQLEEELFGASDQSSEEGVTEDHSTQIEETKALIENTPKIIFDDFYEASTTPSPTSEPIDFESMETDIVTTFLPTTVVCNNLLTQMEKANDDVKVIVEVMKHLKENEQKEVVDSQNSSKNKDYDGKATKQIEIIMVDVKESQDGMQTDDEGDTIKANVTKLNIGDENIQVYKAEIDEISMSLTTEQNSEADLFERLALSVVNNAKSIDYLNQKKSERKRKRKVIKQKIKRKQKQGVE